ncbi:MCE family protein [Nocardia sp. NPDC127579]|uniref:MCE family protein n=1 Tax=Nocardia sp. NPDC127579 TaxID=3345402 RepID=UPI0036409A7A
MNTLSPRAILLRLTLFTSAVLALLLLVVNAITRPVDGETTTYTAEFTDASGLKTGDDVRMFGVGVGKVTGIALRGAHASVRFTLDDRRPVYDTSVFAIRYQTLTGQRYVDIRQPDRPGTPLPRGAAIDVAHTVPSFDITQLFNGLRPVLQEFSPGALNQFTTSVLAVIEGNGSGIGPALDALEKLSRYTTDRQAVIATIVANLHAISGQIGGRSPHLVTLLRGIAEVITAFRAKLDGLIDFAAVAPTALGPLNRLLDTLGFTERRNPDVYRDLLLLFPDPGAAADAVGKLPGLLQALSALLPPAQAGPGAVALTCSRGKAELPQVLSVLVGGQRVAICNG